jgi:hypothetical protein
MWWKKLDNYELLWWTNDFESAQNALRNYEEGEHAIKIQRRLMLGKRRIYHHPRHVCSQMK